MQYFSPEFVFGIGSIVFGEVNHLFATICALAAVIAFVAASILCMFHVGDHNPRRD
jgi:hypothetical protein